MARLGLAWPGKARQGVFTPVHRIRRRGEARPGLAWLGVARQGKVCFNARTQDQAAGRGRARHGLARQGKVFFLSHFLEAWQ